MQRTPKGPSPLPCFHELLSQPPAPAADAFAELSSAPSRNALAIIIPAPHVNRVVDTLLQKGHIPRGYLGVGLQTVRLPEALRHSLQRKEKTGAILLEVEPGGPAQKAGMLIGDILVSLAGHNIARFEDVQFHLQPENIGKSLTAKIVRGGAVQEVSVAVAERPRGDN